MKPFPPVAMTIAGSDCSSGAGIQADLKTFQHYRVHGLTAITCIVSETANLVRAVSPVPVEIVADQVSLMLESFEIAAVKTGMLFSAAHVTAVAEILQKHPGVSLVVDPVMVASTGASLLQDDAIAAYREILLPLAKLITPNLPEAEVLLGGKISSPSDLADAAKKLSQLYGTAILLKGGHLDGPDCIDLLVDGNETHRFSAPRLSVKASHGTGCTLSAAIVAELSHGKNLADAVRGAKHYLGQTLEHSYHFSSPDSQELPMLNQGTLAF
jgi:hydroxymethylpyrimidine/phosphomethylpyrimidine kinase